MPPQDIKGTAEVSQVSGHYLAFYHHIINIDFNVLAQLWFEHSRHHPLIGGTCVLQAKRHYFVVVVPSMCHKGCLLLILQGQWYLMIDLKGIQETHPRMARCYVLQLVYPRHGEWVLWQALFRSVKSTQTRHSPLFFLTTMVLANHSG